MTGTMKKITVIILAVLALTLALSIVFMAPLLDLLGVDQSGWEREETAYRYRDRMGDYVSGWQTIDGRTYYFDPQTNVMRTGWLELSGTRYYLSQDGTAATGWLTLEDGSHYLNQEGAAVPGWLELEGTLYLLDAQGRPTTGWITQGADLYYADEAGLVQRGWYTLGKNKYYADETGALQLGWLDLEGNRYFQDQNGIQTGWMDHEGQQYFFNGDGCLHYGWLGLPEGQLYLGSDGTVVKGWQEIDGQRYYFNENGMMQTGWVEEDGVLYYLLPTGGMAKGHALIDGQDYYFTSTGANIIMVNRWHSVPEDYEVDLITTWDGQKVARECQDSLEAMLQACQDAGCQPYIFVGYRSEYEQDQTYQGYINYFMRMGYSAWTAQRETDRIVAPTGNSEHHLGLAVDLQDRKYDSDSDNPLATTVWLREHCWEYGWILRYLDGKEDITGYKYEPWHFRYVGVELAMELKDSGLTLEEYLDALTTDGTTCSDPDAGAEEGAA